MLNTVKTKDEKEITTSATTEVNAKNVFIELGKMVMEFAIILFLVLMFTSYVGQRTIVDGSSMSTTLSDKDNLFVNKIMYRFSDPQRFDVVIFPHDGINFIKRVIALPGETVRIDEAGNIYINDEILDESYGFEPIDPALRGIAAEGVTLGEDEYFCMGDNRNNSYDSRFEDVGPVHRDEILGRATFRFFPFNKACQL